MSPKLPTCSSQRLTGSHGLGGGGETVGEEAADLGMHGLGATAGLAPLLRVAGEGWERADGGARRPGLGAMGGGEGLPLAAGSLGLGAKGGFFTPAHGGKSWTFTDLVTLPLRRILQQQQKSFNTTPHPTLDLNMSSDSCRRRVNLRSPGHSGGHTGGTEGLVRI